MPRSLHPSDHNVSIDEKHVPSYVRPFTRKHLQDQPQYGHVVTGKPAVHGTQAVQRALDLEAEVANHHLHGGITQADLATQLDLSRPTCIRLLDALERRGRITRRSRDGSDDRYVMGPEFERQAIATTFAHDARRIVDRLARHTRDDGILWVRHGSHGLCLYRTAGAEHARTSELAEGEWYPLGIGGGGLALLADLDEDDAEAAMTETADEVDSLVGSTIRFGTPWIRSHLAVARRDGYGYNDGLVYPERHSIAVAVPGTPYALSIATIHSRMHEHGIEHLARLLHHSARELLLRWAPHTPHTAEDHK